MHFRPTGLPLRMNTIQLIDAIFQQTTVLIAELSTAAGSRAPLAHVADQVFRDLTAEIERQGVRQKVVADMFGMALRSYQKKVRRLRESETHKNKTLWEVVVNFISTNGPVTRAEILRRLRYDDERDVAAVLLDLNQTGLIHASGRGDETIYGTNEARDLEGWDKTARFEAACDYVWLRIAREGTVDRAALLTMLPYDEELLDQALAHLVRSGRVESCPTEEGSSPRYASSRCFLPVGHEHGWEAAVFDHYQTITLAIANKVKRGKRRANADDNVGGGTLCFDLRDGHPLEQEVLSVFRDVRRRVSDVWQRVEAYNDQNPIAPADLRRVWFYYGQNVKSESDAED